MPDYGVVRELIEEGLDDWVPVDRLLGLAEDVAQDRAAGFRDVATDLLRWLLTSGLMAVGDLGGSGFEAWPETGDELLAKAVRVLDGFDWNPQGGAYWLANTPKGDAAASGGEEPRSMSHRSRGGGEQPVRGGK
ncbi:hypothetical protein AQI88_41385 [Streptomyces cellostaticus]|uniref:Uncharacterized protein n=1 Tax=Streptomyces cellostaticus TaxID=67285 RepID=A0A124H9V9_9ACTN|nr:hypothetical protein [Streptomyces cellostaticus]KUM86198.1 hypothetical protein AQI88_41385 [Streptomyces cellostaticus]GHI09668.1 hypothetical protein Scel_79890 [Streptomyces cellostaticus]